MIVAREALDRSSLITPGAPVYWYSRIRLNEGIVAERWITNFERAEPHAGYRIVNAENGVPGAERTLALVTTLLNFFASGVLLLGCIGISHSVTVWLERKLPNIAIFKSVGAMTPLIMRIYLIQIIGAAAIGVATGLTLGVYLYTNCIQFLGSWLPVKDVFPLKPLLLAGGFVFSAAILFSLLPLANVEVSKPNLLFLNVAKSTFAAAAACWVTFVILLITSATLCFTRLCRHYIIRTSSHLRHCLVCFSRSPHCLHSKSCRRPIGGSWTPFDPFRASQFTSTRCTHNHPCSCDGHLPRAGDFNR